MKYATHTRRWGGSRVAVATGLYSHHWAGGSVCGRAIQDSNLVPAVLETAALPIELMTHGRDGARQGCNIGNMGKDLIIEPGDPLYAGCMPVDNEANRRNMPAMFSVELLDKAGLPPDGLTRPVYKNSVQGACELCEADVWVGPKIANAKVINPGVCIVCMQCAVEVGEARRQVEVFTLSNKGPGE
jgi:hypothetical protein